MKLFQIIILLIILTGCSEEETQLTTFPQFSRIKEGSTKRTSPDSTVNWWSDYKIDSGFVIEMNGIYHFDYNEEGKLIRLRENQDTIANFHWENDNCIIKLKNGTVQITYSDDQIVAIDNRRYEYDGENITKVYQDGELLWEYLNYNLQTIHPFYYLKSIEPWLGYRQALPISKNIFEIRRDQPYTDYDLHMELIEYKYEYEKLDNFQVTSISPEWTNTIRNYEFYPQSE